MSFAMEWNNETRVSPNKLDVTRKHIIAPKVYEEHATHLYLRPKWKHDSLLLQLIIRGFLQHFQIVCWVVGSYVRHISDYHFYRPHLLSKNVNLVTWYLSWIGIIWMMDNSDSNVNVSQFLFFVIFPTMVICCRQRCWLLSNMFTTSIHTWSLMISKNLLEKLWG